MILQDKGTGVGDLDAGKGLQRTSLESENRAPRRCVHLLPTEKPKGSCGEGGISPAP